MILLRLLPIWYNIWKASLYYKVNFRFGIIKMIPGSLLEENVVEKHRKV